MWIRDPAFGVDFGKLVHSAQWAEFPHPLPPTGEVIGRARVVSLADRGEGRGAVLVLERTIEDAADGRLYCRLRQTLLLRGDGGFGGEPAPRAEQFAPNRPADAMISVSTSPRAALIYRLSGDWNPLHLDPDVAARAGLPAPDPPRSRPAMAWPALPCRGWSGSDPAAMVRLACRFSGIVLPGDDSGLSRMARGFGHGTVQRPRRRSQGARRW